MKHILKNCPALKPRFIAPKLLQKSLMKVFSCRLGSAMRQSVSLELSSLEVAEKARLLG